MGKLFLTPPDFNFDTAREAAALVQNAYAQFAQGSGWNIANGYDLLKVLQPKPEGWLAHDERFGFVARNQRTGAVFVVFRGTQSAEDWLSNVTFPQVNDTWGWGKVEEGFFKLYRQCSADILATVSGATSDRIVVTGHSLGAALATLASADLTAASRRVAMYNFASPRTGDIQFAARFDTAIAESWRVVNTEDIVTTVPLATLELAAHGVSRLHMIMALAQIGTKFNFEHVGMPVCFTTHNGSILANHEMATYAAALA